MNLKLENKTILLTGAGRGLGRAIAISLAEEGANVIAVSRTQADLDDLQNLYPEQIEAWCMDVASREFLQRIEQQDSIDALVNNAGTNSPQPFLDATADVLDYMLNLNVRSAFLVAQSSARVMAKQKSGVIINMSSQLGHVGCAGRTVYCMTKHALEGLTKAMAVELAPLGIRVNSIAPTFVETPMTRPMFNDAEFSKSVLDRIPLGRLGQPEEIASAVIFMISNMSSMVTGTSLVVDGGWTAQ